MIYYTIAKTIVNTLSTHADTKQHTPHTFGELLLGGELEDGYRAQVSRGEGIRRRGEELAAVAPLHGAHHTVEKEGGEERTGKTYSNHDCRR